MHIFAFVHLHMLKWALFCSWVLKLFYLWNARNKTLQAVHISPGTKCCCKEIHNNMDRVNICMVNFLMCLVPHSRLKSIHPDDPVCFLLDFLFCFFNSEKPFSWWTVVQLFNFFIIYIFWYFWKCGSRNIFKLSRFC